MNLLRETKALFKQHRAANPHQTLKQLAERSGLGFEWTKDFHYDRFHNPRVRHVQKMYDYLVSCKRAANARQHLAAQRRFG